MYCGGAGRVDDALHGLECIVFNQILDAFSHFGICQQRHVVIFSVGGHPTGIICRYGYKYPGIEN